MTIKTLLFDLGNVLAEIDPDGLLTTNGFIKYNKNFSDIIQQPQCIKLMSDYDLGKITSCNFRKLFKKLLSIEDMQDTEFDNTWNAFILPLCEKKLKFINSLKNHYKVFLLTNINEINLTGINKKCKFIGIDNLSNIFDKTYYSYEIGYKKPDIEAFKLILDEQKLNPKEVLFLDDSDENIEAAKKLGIQGMQVQFHTNLKNLLSDMK
jgi:HAD superfamily hydrolase (TIGR01509 family)